MDLKEKIRMMGILISVAGLLLISFGLVIDCDIPRLMRLITMHSPAGVGSYLTVFGSALMLMSLLLPAFENAKQRR